MFFGGLVAELWNSGTQYAVKQCPKFSVKLYKKTA